MLPSFFFPSVSWTSIIIDILPCILHFLSRYFYFLHQLIYRSLIFLTLIFPLATIFVLHSFLIFTALFILLILFSICSSWPITHGFATRRFITPRTSLTNSLCHNFTAITHLTRHVPFLHLFFKFFLFHQRSRFLFTLPSLHIVPIQFPFYARYFPYHILSPLFFPFLQSSFSPSSFLSFEQSVSFIVTHQGAIQFIPPVIPQIVPRSTSYMLLCNCSYMPNRSLLVSLLLPTRNFPLPPPFACLLPTFGLKSVITPDNQPLLASQRRLPLKIPSALRHKVLLGYIPN